MTTRTLSYILVHKILCFHYGSYAYFWLYSSIPYGTLNVPFTLNCNTTSKIFNWKESTGPIQPAIVSGAYINGSCQFDSRPLPDYIFTCDTNEGLYTMTVPGTLMTNTFHNTKWRCEDIFGAGHSNTFALKINIPVSSLSLVSTATDSNLVEINESDTKPFECRTNIIRPAASIEWYLGEENITGLGTSKTEIVGNDKVISSSTISYIADKDDNGNILYCTAVNIPNRNPVKSVGKLLNIQYGPTRIDITPTTTFYTVTEAGNLDKITCSADCNPNCTMTWTGPHIPQGTTSALNLQSIDRSHAGSYYCTASNTIGSQVTVTVKVVVYYGPRIVDISPDTTSYAVTENTGIDQIICSADCKPNCTMTWTGPNLPQGTTSALNLNNIDRNQAGSYHCTARNNIGSRKSITVQIIVNYAPDTTPTVQQIPKGVIVPGNKVTLTCTLSGGHPLAVLSWDCKGTYTNNTSRNTASYSVEFTADTTYNNKICNCSATHLFTSYRRSVKHELQVYCSPQYIQIHEGRGLFTAGIASLVIGLLALILTIVLIACWRVRITKTPKSPDHYTEFNTKSSTETVAYDVINQTTNIDTNRSATEDIDRGVYSYEECQPCSTTDHDSDDLRQEPKCSKMMTGEEYDYVKV